MAVFLVSPVEQIQAKDNENVIAIMAEGTGEAIGEAEDIETGDEESEEPTIAEIEEQIYVDLKKGGYELDNTSDITDKNLYSALLQIAKQYIKDTYYGYIYSDSTLWTTMLKNVENVTIENMDIEDLSGIEKIRFDNLKSLTITGNKFATVPSTFFDRMGNLEQLNLSNNNISSIEFPSHMALNKINLSSNKLSKVNFSQLKNLNLDINVANNRFTSITDIGFSTRLNHLNLNIINNNITDITDEYLDNSKINLSVGLQGLVPVKDNTTITTSEKLRFYKFNNPDIYIKFYKVGIISDTYTGVSCMDSSITDGDYIEFGFEVGEYYAEYYDNIGQIYESGDSEKGIYKTYHFNVIPGDVVFKYEFKGKTYDTFDKKVTGKVKVYLSCEDGGEIYYKLGNSEWTKGTEINCDKGGDYSIVAKVVKDGVESNEKTVLVRTSLNVIIPDIVMLILILLFTLTLFLLVVPYVSKKWFRN